MGFLDGAKEIECNTNKVPKHGPYTPWLSLNDGTEVVIGKLRNPEALYPLFEVHIERPGFMDFNTLRIDMPFYDILVCDGFSEEEVAYWLKYLSIHQSKLFDVAERGY